ncbi:MAG: hypothetical protein ACKOYP_14405 [Bacteroidota bacterium]
MNRLTRHLKTHLPRYGGEFLIIFLSITLTWWVDDLRQDLEDRRQEKRHLTNLMKNLETDSLNIIREMEGMENSRKGLNDLYTRLDQSGTNPVDSLERYIIPLIVVPEFHPAKSEYEALKSSGRLTLIQDDDLSENLMELYEVTYGQLDFMINITTITFQQHSWDHTIRNFDLTGVLGPKRAGTTTRLFNPSERALLLNKIVFCSLAVRTTIPRFEACLQQVKKIRKLTRARISQLD